MNPAEGVSVRTGWLVAVLSGMGCWLALALAGRAGAGAPVLTWYGLVPLLLIAALVLVMCWQVRRYVRAPRRTRLSPQRGRATLVGAQAAALGGAALVGWYVANALVHLPHADVPSVREQLTWALVHIVAAAVLAVAGYVGQAWCRIPPEEDDDDPQPEGDLAYG